MKDLINTVIQGDCSEMPQENISVGKEQNYLLTLFNVPLDKQKTNIKDDTNDWRQEWKDMPEFVQDKKKAYSQIIFRFDNEEDLQAFAKLIGQKLTNKTKSAWFPFKSHWGGVKKVWTDEK